MNTHDQRNAQYIECMAHDYLKGTLSPEEQVIFEEYLMEHPDILENLQIDSLLAQTLSEVAMPSKKRLELFKGNFRLSWLSSLSLLGLGAIGAYVSMFIISLLNAPVATVHTLESVVYVETMRSVNSEQVAAKLPLSAGNIGLMIAADFDQAGPFEVSISEYSTQRLVIELENVHKTENDDLAVILNTRIFNAGLYQVTTTDLGTGEQKGLIVEFSEHMKKD